MQCDCWASGATAGPPVRLLGLRFWFVDVRSIEAKGVNKSPTSILETKRIYRM